MSVPIIVGVTGHRKLRSEDIPALKSSVRQELISLRKRCPCSSVVMLTSLAEGADQLCTEVAQSLGIPYIAALPMEKEEYLKDFDGEARTRFLSMCGSADSLLITPAAEAVPEAPDRDFYYRQAGIYIVEHCHVLLALWDGGCGSPNGCGTAEAVDFVRRGSYAPVNNLALRSGGNELVIHITAPRRNACSDSAGNVSYLGDADAFYALIKKTDDFNRLAASCTDGSYPLFSDNAETDTVLSRLDSLYQSADALSLRYAKRFRRVLGWLAAISTAVTVCFLLYDVIALYWMLFFCGAALLSAVGWLIYAGRSDCHKRYIEFRELAEALRVQAYLRYAGSSVEVKDILSWSQQDGTPWVFGAMCAVSAVPPPTAKHSILDCWVNAQRDYHSRAEIKTVHTDETSTRIVRIALILSIVLYIGTIFFELSFGAFGACSGNSELIRVIIKILLGSFSAATLFISNYYGKLSLPRKRDDHAKMFRFYSKMSEQLAMRGQTDELLTLLAREELIENSNWCSYQKDNAPSFNL